MAKKIDKQELTAAIERKVARPYEPVKPAMQLGFIHHNVDCIGCRACEIACKDKNGLPRAALPAGDVRRRAAVSPTSMPTKVNMSCNHCAEPACLPTCPTGAIWKRADNGVVDIDSTLCIGCRKCEAACPTALPQRGSRRQVIKKCNFCIDELDAGRKPYCVMACMMRVLDMGPIDKLLAGSHKTTAPVRGEAGAPGQEYGRPGTDPALHRLHSPFAAASMDRDLAAALADDLDAFIRLHDPRPMPNSLAALQAAGFPDSLAPGCRRRRRRPVGLRRAAPGSRRPGHPVGGVNASTAWPPTTPASISTHRCGASLRIGVGGRRSPDLPAAHVRNCASVTPPPACGGRPAPCHDDHLVCASCNICAPDSWRPMPTRPI